MGDSNMNAEVNKKVDLLNMLKDKKDKLISAKEAALLLRVSLSTVYRLIEEGKLKAIRTGERNTWVFESSLSEYLDSLNTLLLDE
jgi:excisionase family DNA binding protein